MTTQRVIRRDLIVSPWTSTVSPKPNNEASVTPSQTKRPTFS